MFNHYSFPLFFINLLCTKIEIIKFLQHPCNYSKIRPMLPQRTLYDKVINKYDKLTYNNMTMSYIAQSDKLIILPISICIHNTFNILIKECN